MQILTKNTLPLGGFAGLTEHRLVTDRRVFGARKQPNTFDGIGNFVYLADATFNPYGETHMHPHKEIDVITIMMDGRVTHEGSLEHGQNLDAGEAQIQRAGGEGFSHNEINPDPTKNRLLQLWVLPDELGEPAGYKHYTINSSGTTRIYGGSKNQTTTFNSKTYIDVVRLQENEQLEHNESEMLVYVASGSANFTDKSETFEANEGDLIRITPQAISATSSSEIIIIGEI